MNKKTAIFMISLLVLFLAACNNQAIVYHEIDAVLGEESEPYIFELPDYTAIHISDEITITIAYATDDFFAMHENYIEFSARGGDPRGGIAFMSNVPVRNFRYIQISGAEIRFIVEKDLFALDELFPETPLIVDWRAMGSGAYGGFAFDDENGTTRYVGFNYCAVGDNAFRWIEFDGGLSLEPEITEPIELTVDDIPYGVDITDFIRELGYDSFAEHEFLQWGTYWIALRANAVIRDLRIIDVIPHYDASFDDGWQFELRYRSSEWTRIKIELLPGEPFVMAWDERGLTEQGFLGVSYTDVDGSERFFLLRHDGSVTYLYEFENTPQKSDSPMITIIRPSPEIELVVAWFVVWSDDGWYSRPATDSFLQQFESYAEFDNPYSNFSSYVVFSANMDLYNFQFFRLGHDFGSCVDDEWHHFYVGTMLGFQDVLPFGEPVVIPWHPGGTWPQFGISFLDETGERRNFTLNSNEGSGFPPMFIFEFVDRGYCVYCL